MSAQRQDGTPSGSALPLLYAGTVGKQRLSCPLFDSFMFKISSIFIMCFFSHIFTYEIVLYNECFYSLLYFSAIHGIIAP